MTDQHSSQGQDGQVPVEQVPPAEEPSNPRRKWLLWGTAAAAVPVLALGTFFGVSLMRGNESGAASADEAASTFINSVKANDVTRASQFIVPEEARGLTSLMDQGAKKAQKGQGADATSSPNDLLSGIKIKTTSLKTRVSNLPVPAEGVKKVEFTGGSVDASYDPAKADPLMKDFIKSIDGDQDEPAKESGSIADARKESGRNPYAVVVQRGDSWYVSPTYTVLEQAAQDEGVKPAPGTVKTTSYPSAEAAATAFTKGLAASVSANSVDPILKTLSPYEAQLLKRYEPLMEEDSGDDSGATARVISSRFHKPTNDGDRERIRPKNVQIGVTETDSYGDPEEEVVTFRGGCVIADGESTCSESRSGRLIDQYAKGLVVKRGAAGWNVEYLPSLIAVTSDIVNGASRGELEDAADEV